MLVGSAAPKVANDRDIATPTPYPSPQGGGELLAFHLYNSDR